MVSRVLERVYQQNLTENQPNGPTNQKTNLKYSWLVMVGQKNQPKTNKKPTNQDKKPTFAWLVADPSSARRVRIRHSLLKAHSKNRINMLMLHNQSSPWNMNIMYEML